MKLRIEDDVTLLGRVDLWDDEMSLSNKVPGNVIRRLYSQYAPPDKIPSLIPEVYFADGAVLIYSGESV